MSASGRSVLAPAVRAATSRHYRSLAASAVVLLGTSAAVAGPQYGGQFGPGNTWNVYEVITGPAVTWDQARVNAAATSFNGTPGRLVSIHSVQENTFVGFVAPGDLWIGLTDSDQTSTLDGFNPGGTEAGTNPNGGWRWVSGEAFSYQAFGTGEPNDVGGEDAVHKRGDGLWNDHQAGPSLGQGGHTLGYVIEYPTAAANSPVAGISENIGGQGGQGYWDVREVRGVTDNPNINSLQTAIGVLRQDNATPGTLSRTSGQVPYIDFADPESAGGQGFPTGTQTFLSNTAADDQDFALIANATIDVPQTGQYTFHVQSDDGFALRIAGANFSINASSQDGGGAFVVSGDTVIFNSPTGNSNTFALTNLTQGLHDIEFLFFEDGGGAFVELSSALGNFSAFDANAFDRVGDVANGGIPVVAIPEPASAAALMLIGFAGMAARRRRA